MSKRILAAFLAVMMVVGLLPTTAFAVNNGCAVLDHYQDHSKEHCTNAGVSYEMVPNSTVEPACGQDGYTLYQCACGAYFADDIIDMDDHVFGAVKAERVEPSCFALGKAAVFTCANCGNDYYDPEDPDADENGNIAKVPHTCDEISYPGNDCTASEKACQTPGCTYKDPTHVPAEKHNWDYANGVITVAPTEETEGTAVFSCTNDHCTQTKEVEVLVLDHVHVMTYTSAVARGDGCEDTGMLAYYTCSVCGNKYYDEAGLLKVEKDEDLIIPAVGHTWTEEPYVIPATCTTWGFEYYGCTKCNIKGETKDLDPLGHTTYEQAVAHDADEEKVAVDGLWITTTEGTCSVGTKYEWACERCGRPDSKQDAAVDHEYLELNVPASCKSDVKYTIVYCTRDICDADAVAEFVKDGETYDVTVEVKDDGNVYDLADTATLKVVDIKNVEEVEEPTAHFYLTEVINEPTCTDEGKNFYYCEICNDHFEKNTKALGHEYLDTVAGKANDTDATCTADATQGCDRDDCDHVKVLTGTKGHKWSDEFETVAPKCDGTKGYDEYPCENCTATDKRNYTNFVANKSYETLEAAQAEHAGLSTTKEIFREGDCELNGYWKYACADCEKNVLVKIDGTGEGHKRPAKDATNYHAEATCTQWKGWEATNCTVCGDEIAKEVETPALGHAMTKFDKVPATCEDAGNEEYYTCGRACCEDIIYKDRDGEDTWENNAHILPALNHNYSSTEAGKTCTTDGYVHHICLNCGDEYVDGYEEKIGHKKGAKEYQEPTCTVDGYENYLCGNGCGAYYSEKVLPATGHTNKAGETITDICTDTVKDRNCVNENCPIPADQNNCHPVAKSHAEVEDVVPAHCEHYGYTMITCANGCGELDEVIAVQEPTGHLAPWGQYIKAEDMTALNEDVVWYWGEEFLYAENYDGPITAYTAPTYESLGSITFKCGALNCADEITRDVIRTGVDFTIEIDNAAVSGEYTYSEYGYIEFVDSDVIAVDVYMNAYNTNVWGFNFDLDYDDDSMTYLGYVFHAGDVFGKYMVNNNDAAVAGDYDVSVSAYTEQEMDGSKLDALVNGSVKVVTLYFQVEAIYLDQYDFEFYFDDTANMYIYNAWMSNSEGAEEFCGIDGAYFEIIDMMDTNANEIYNIKDLQNCYDIIKGVYEDEYVSAADANKDGIINLVDLQLMNEYLVGAVSELDVYAALNWNAPEGFVAG